MAAPDGRRQQKSACWSLRYLQPKRAGHQVDVSMHGCQPRRSLAATPPQTSRRASPSPLEKLSNHSLPSDGDRRQTSWIGPSPQRKGTDFSSIFTKRVRVSGTRIEAGGCRRPYRPRIVMPGRVTGDGSPAMKQPPEPADWRYRPIAATSRSESASSQTDSGG